MHRTRLYTIAALAALGVSAPLWGPVLLRQVPWFAVRRVEVSGTHLLAPHEVLATSGIRPGANVWDPVEGWESALRAHPAVADARITRQLPHALRVRVEEKRPVALVEAATLRPVSASGELLPHDPARVTVDLPIVRGPWADSAARRVTRSLVEETARLAQLDPGLMADVSEVRAGPAGSAVLVLAHRMGEIVIPAGLGSERLAQLRAVLVDLQRRLPAASDTPGGGARLDLRYPDQIVVRLPSSV